MAQRARDNRISRRSWLLAGLTIPLFRARAAEKLSATFDGDNLYPVAPALHFLAGKPLDRLRDANAVAFVSRIAVFTDDRGTLFREVQARLIVSFDIWDEKFKVKILGASQSRDGLSAKEAEAWCMDNLAISALGLAPNRPFWLRFELSTVPKQNLSSILGDSGISLTGMIEILGRKAVGDEPRWLLETGPLRLSELPRPPVRTARHG